MKIKDSNNLEIKMRKLIIVEIENSYLNFFTPAVCIAAGLFLYSLISWPLSLLNWVFQMF